MSFEHAQEMHHKYMGLGIRNICIPTSLDASLQHLDVPEDLYPESHDNFERMLQLADPEERQDINEDFTYRIVAATFGPESPLIFGMKPALIYELELGKGDPFQKNTTDPTDAEFESPLADHEDLQGYIDSIDGDPDVEQDIHNMQCDQVRHFFVVSRLLRDHGLTLNIDARNHHQIGLRQEDEDTFYLIDTGTTDRSGKLRKIGPLTLREVCGIREEPWSHRPGIWSPVDTIRSFPLSFEEDGKRISITHLFPPEPKLS